MNPSYNSSLGSYSGNGDIVLAGTGTNNKSKKWLLIGLVCAVAAIVVVGIVALVMLSGKKNDEDVVGTNESVFHEFLNKNRDAINTLESTVDYFYSGVAYIADFVVTDAEKEAALEVLDDGMEALEEVKERVSAGPELTGVFNEIDLADYYQKLSNTIDGDLERYRNFIDLTTKFYKISADTDIQNTFSGYSADVISLANAIKSYYDSRASLASRYLSNGCNEGTDNFICNSINEEAMMLQKSLNVESALIPQAYKNYLGEFNYKGDGSVIDCLNNLYAGTEELNADQN